VKKVRTALKEVKTRSILRDACEYQVGRGEPYEKVIEILLSKERRGGEVNIQLHQEAPGARRVPVRIS